MTHETFIDTQTTKIVKALKDDGYSDERIMQHFMDVDAQANILLQVAKAIFVSKLDS